MIFNIIVLSLTKHLMCYLFLTKLFLECNVHNIIFINYQQEICFLEFRILPF